MGQAQAYTRGVRTSLLADLDPQLHSCLNTAKAGPTPYRSPPRFAFDTLLINEF